MNMRIEHIRLQCLMIKRCWWIEQFHLFMWDTEVSAYNTLRGIGHFNVSPKLLSFLRYNLEPKKRRSEEGKQKMEERIIPKNLHLNLQKRSENLTTYSQIAVVCSNKKQTGERENTYTGQCRRTFCSLISDMKFLRYNAVHPLLRRAHMNCQHVNQATTRKWIIHPSKRDHLYQNYVSLSIKYCPLKSKTFFLHSIANCNVSKTASGLLMQSSSSMMIFT